MKKLFSILLLVLFTGLLFANPVTEKQARQVALNFYSYKAQGIKSDVKITKSEEFKYEGMTAFYIYSFKNGGFVIISADDAAMPILGYSVENKLRDNRTNEALESWLEGYAKQIKWIADSKLDNSQTLVEWNKILVNDFSQKSTKVVTPLLTTTWDQGGNYNDYCPAAWTGCVATAMAQIMNYWEYPETGVSQHSYVHPNYGLQSASFKTATYDWASMPDNTGGDAVSWLMYHCGVSVDMDYDNGGSGAQSSDVPHAMANYFKYDQSIDYVSQDEYTNTDWINLIKDQLDNAMPVYYSGSSQADGGHAFVFDGYNASDQFHVNWGWSGSANGYYAVGSLNPSGMDFNDGNAAVINIFPASTPEFFAVKKFSDLSNVAASASAYIGYMNATNDYVAWGTASDGSGGGANYRIYTKTVDGGLTWDAKSITNLGGTSFSMIQGLSDQIAFIAMWGSNQSNNKILKTTDGGDTWTSILSGAHSASFFNVVHFFDENNGFVQGDPDSEFELHTTTDGGATWTRVDGADIPDPLTGEFGIVGHYTAIGDDIWFSTNMGRCYKSTDKGYTWTVSTLLDPGTNSTYIDLAFSDNATNGLALVTVTDGTNFSYQYFKTTDGGDYWTEITSPTGNFYDGDVSAVPGVDNFFVSVGSDWETPKMGISYSMDGGDTWMELADYYQNHQFTSVAMASAEKGFFGNFTGDYEGGAWVFGDSEPVYAVFYGEDTLACVNSDFVYTSASTGEIDNYAWDFGADATPAIATGAGPHTVQYTTPGYKTVALTVSNAETSHTLTMTDYVLVADIAPNTITEITGLDSVYQSTTHTYSVPDQDYTYFDWSCTQGMWTLNSDYLNTTSLTFTTFLVDGTLSVIPFNGCGVGSQVDIDIEVVEQVGIDELGNNISISPNPASDMISITSDKTIGNVEILSAEGKVVYSVNQNSKEANINITNLDKGMYIVNVTTENGTSTTKIIVE
ncbi:MAG: C10 family peptidase [Bacteroidales bacterium]|nr:C10 family peptidase [Bacteroidales bacterium]